MDDLTFHAAPLPPGQASYLLMGGAEGSAPLADGRLCVTTGGQGLFRFPPLSTAGGSLQLGPGLAAQGAALFGPPGTIQPGSSWSFQLWYRDPQGPCGAGSNLSSAVSATFTP